ncbi:cytochrome c oxidase subunit 2 [Marinithermofilum abyssi]|uniref:Cytochrome c oxidase subunit 2 n=1 Tax=Marinithermofilum abyssi TaxID=1571185 RepID=A0A8J2Y9R5_9BACL|nr:cytochrome c oxidase subunit II [Marinithermofilum abyssi]GGE26926.1 cytochrome c oxidase subunit 2 [Marinithermofilum abyssi]
MKRKGLIRAAVLLSGVSAVTGCGNRNISVLKPAGPVGDSQMDLIRLSLVIMTLVVIVVSVLYIYAVVRFRERPGQKKEIPEQVEGSKKLELLWTIIPILLLVILGIPTVSTTFQLNKKPEPAESMRVNVTGYQYWWAFEYPDYGFETANEVHIPAGKKVEFIMTSHDVIHAFWVPSLGGKQDLSPGRINRLVLQADKPGIYEGRCTELCGAGHALMNFRVIVQQPEDFEAWVNRLKKPDSQPDNDTAAEGKKLFAQNCMGCHAIQGAGYKVLGQTGPELTGLSYRTRLAGVVNNTKEDLSRWITNPQRIKPGNHMPAFDHLTEKQRKALTEYLSGLK